MVDTHDTSNRSRPLERTSAAPRHADVRGSCEWRHTKCSARKNLDRSVAAGGFMDRICRPSSRPALHLALLGAITLFACVDNTSHIGEQTFATFVPPLPGCERVATPLQDPAGGKP